MAQHFLLSAKARSLSLARVAHMSDEEAHAAFKMIRWSDTKGEPVCPRCGCFALYTYRTRDLCADSDDGGQVFRLKADSVSNRLRTPFR
jgi:hypothetical protein